MKTNLNLRKNSFKIILISFSHFWRGHFLFFLTHIGVNLTKLKTQQNSTNRIEFLFTSDRLRSGISTAINYNKRKKNTIRIVKKILVIQFHDFGNYNQMV